MRSIAARTLSLNPLEGKLPQQAGEGVYYSYPAICLMIFENWNER